MNSPLDIQLLPCPFCENPAAIEHENGRHWVECTFCGMEGLRMLNRDAAVKFWNRRPSPVPAPARSLCKHCGKPDAEHWSEQFLCHGAKGESSFSPALPSSPPTAPNDLTGFPMGEMMAAIAQARQDGSWDKVDGIAERWKASRAPKGDRDGDTVGSQSSPAVASIDQGGPAFPVEVRRDLPPLWHPNPGMTLRDYFAAKALPIFLETWKANDAAFRAYAIADAMITARKGEAPQAIHPPVPPMEWTKDKPTVSGWYWYRDRYQSAGVWRLIPLVHGRMAINGPVLRPTDDDTPNLDAEWSGPIPAPMEGNPK